MPPTPSRHPRRLSGLVRLRRGSAAQGQSLVEFSLILAPLLFILLGIIQFGFIFQGYIALSNAVRESARVATVYVYDVSLSRSANDTARNALARTTLLASFNGLAKTSPNFSTSGSWTTTTSGTTVTATNGDMTITYVLPASVTDNDPRQGYRFTLRADYHQDLVVPLISALLPKDANGRLVLTGEVTMVLN
jgi:Flp pilus assembly protein TadG